MKNNTYIWKKYSKCNTRYSGERTSYDELYNDLKNSNKDWTIAQEYDWCKDHLCGELVPCDNIKPGDIYVYYEQQNEKLIPIFYFKIEEHIDYETKERKNYITINEASVGFDKIEDKYLPILINKLNEIDQKKNKIYVDILQKRYNEYIKLCKIINQKELNEEDIGFIYYMACIKKHPLAISNIQNRNIQNDFDNLSKNNKVELFLIVQSDPICNLITITDKNILILIAQNKCLRFFKNISQNIINDKEFVMSLLLHFFKSDKGALNKHQLIWHLPSIYQTDIEILELIFYNYTTSICLDVAKWIESSKDYELLKKNREFACRLIDSFTRSLIMRNQTYYNCYMLWAFDNETIEYLDEHILIGPEISEEKQYLKELSQRKLKKDIINSLNYNNQKS